MPRYLFRSIFLKALLFSLLICLFSCDGKRNVDIQPKNLDVHLGDIILVGWDKNLFDLKKLFPNGVLRRGDERKKTAATYYLKVTLTDIELQGDLIIHQREEDLNRKNQSYPPLRVVYIPCKNKETFAKNHKSIKAFLKQKYSVDGNATYLGETDSYHIPLTNNNDWVQIDIEAKENDLNIKLIIQLPQIVERQNV